MKGYFRKDYKINQNNLDVCNFLKEKYDLSDDIFEKRFEGSEMGEKSSELEELISDIELKLVGDKGEYSKLFSLVQGNAYLRLAQCQNEIFKKSFKYYKKAIVCLEEHIVYSNIDEIDLLLMLNKGKYFRNTAEVGRKSDYERALSIFMDVVNSINNVNMSYEKKFHLLLDAKINIGRVTRYSYKLEEAQELFLSLVLALEKYIKDDTKIKLYDCDILKNLLNNASSDKTVEEYYQNVDKNEVYEYVLEYLLQSLIHIGIIFRKKTDYINAQTIFILINSIDESKQDNIDASNNLGVCYRKLGEINGKKTEMGINEYKKAKEIFAKLAEKGNKFATINLYKKYGEAVSCFESVYNEKKHIARGSIGLKAYYNLAQCKIQLNEICQARNILSKIREFLKKNHNYIDIMCENNYGWCLMQEGKYNKALLVYDELLKKLDKTNGNKHILDIYNNIANCYIFLNKQSQANKLLANSFKIENDNKRAMYLKCVSLLNDFVNGGNVSSYKVYKMFNKLIEKNSSETCINS